MSIEKPLRKKPKQKRRYVPTEARLAQQAKFLKRGEQAGRPRQHAEVVGRIRESADEILDTLFDLLRKERLSPGDKIRFLICEGLLDRGFGRAPHTLAAAIQHHTSSDGTALHLEGAAMSPLLQQAHAYAADEAKQLRPPDAVKAIDVAAEPISSQPFIADPAGNIITAPVASAEPATLKPEEPAAAAVETAPEKPPEHAQEASKTKPPFSGIPADGAEYMMHRDRQRADESPHRRAAQDHLS
jgi:hypothetical protein